MRKNFKMYAIIWGILLVVFNAVVFLVRALTGTEIHYDARFWVSWVFVIVAFAGNLACAHIAFKAENLQKMFYNLPLITISFSALIAMLVVSSIFMLIPNCPAWIAAIGCLLILAFNAIAVVKASWAAEAVEAIDVKVKEQTSFIRMITVDAESLISHAKSDEAKAECKKVFEALRYSDPMSNPYLSDIEGKITTKLSELTSAVQEDNSDLINSVAEELLLLISDRNKKCKALK